MKGLVKINDELIDVNGSSLCGYVATTYSYLVERLGMPQTGCDKTTAEWHLEFPDQTIATIYDWKLDQTPLGVYDWHIGGKTNKCLDYVGQLLGLPQESISR